MDSTSHIPEGSNPWFNLLLQLRRECFTETNITHSVFDTLDYYDWESRGIWCDREFDGFTCWDPTPAGAIACQLCPGFVTGFDPQRLVFKRCTEEGDWAVHPITNRSWTNYTTCIDREDLMFRESVNNIYIFGYTISMIALFLSTIIFLYFRNLHCVRVKIHINLFISFLLNCVNWIIWYKIVINNVYIIQDNHVWCQVFHVYMYYIMTCSYMWMFCEAMYLHIALVTVFTRDDITLKWLRVFGWGAPVIIVGAYAVTRYMSTCDDATVRCWMDHHEAVWIITIPVLLSLVGSLGCLVNITRVLIKKLATNEETTVTTKKAVRAVLILIPLFGLHYMLLPLRPAERAPGERIYDIFAAIITSFQGFCVAVLFCFTNQDVSSTLRTHFWRIFERYRHLFDVIGHVPELDHNGNEILTATAADNELVLAIVV